jgi:DinB family protein
MEYRLSAARQILERTPSALEALLGGLSDVWLDATEGPDAWSPRQIVAHLIGAERTAWIPRIRIIFESTEPRPLPPFDRVAEINVSGRRPIGDLLEAFAEARRESLRALSNFVFDTAALSKTGIHPEFGQVELRQLLATWTVHDLSHLSQIERTLAKQYTDAVGPWRVNFRLIH